MSRIVCASATLPKMVGAAQRGFHAGDAAAQPICHRLVVDQAATVGIRLGDLRRSLVDGDGHETGLVHHDRHILQSVCGGLHRAVLDVERFTHHRPAVVHLPEPVLVVDADIAVVDDVGAVAVDGADALDLDARRVQRHQEHRQALVLRRVGIGVGDQEDVLAVVRAGREHLGAVDDPAVAIAHRAGLAGRDVRAALGFGVAKAEPHMPAENTAASLPPSVRARRTSPPTARSWRSCRRSPTARARVASRVPRSGGARG